MSGLEQFLGPTLYTILWWVVVCIGVIIGIKVVALVVWIAIWLLACVFGATAGLAYLIGSLGAWLGRKVRGR